MQRSRDLELGEARLETRLSEQLQKGPVLLSIGLRLQADHPSETEDLFTCVFTDIPKSDILGATILLKGLWFK
jgi:hypothetical protein